MYDRVKAQAPEDTVDGEAGPEVSDAAQVQREAVVMCGRRDGDLRSRNRDGRVCSFSVSHI